MARYELLNNITHKDLRVDTRFGAQFGDETGMVAAFPTEFADLQREYPIFLRKDREDGHWQAVALLGFDAKENLFLQDGRWNAAYLPGAVAQGPFLIGFQEQRVDGELRREPVIHVDMEHPRVASGEGERVFLPHGGNSPYLEHISAVLRGIRNGVEGGGVMYDAFDAVGLIQPMTVELQLDEQRRVSLAGLHGIDRDRLAALDADALHRLNRAGYLEGAYLMLASMLNLRRLMAEKQRRLRQAESR